MHDVLICCRSRADTPEVSTFPNVRAAVLTKYLQRLGLAVVYHPLPYRGTPARTAIWTEYQPYNSSLTEYLGELPMVSAGRLYCMAYSGAACSPPFRADALRWFAGRGGVLVQLSSTPLDLNERYVGVGVDLEVVRYDPEVKRDGILFDFPGETWKHFGAEPFRELRRAFPTRRFVGSGPSEATCQSWFDEWHSYGQEHSKFIAVYRGCAAFVVGWPESLGLAVAEAQLNGLCIVAPVGWTKREMVCRSAKAAYVGGVHCLREAIRHAFDQDAGGIVQEAKEKFDPSAFASRVVDAIGLRPVSPRRRAVPGRTPGGSSTADGIFLLGGDINAVDTVAEALSESGVHAVGALPGGSAVSRRVYIPIAELNRQILAHVGSAFGIALADDDDIARVWDDGGFRVKASGVADRLRSMAGPWFCDDYLSGSVLPFWAREFPKLRRVLVVGDPAHTLMRLRRVYGVSFETALLLWQIHTTRLLRQLASLDSVVFVSAEEILANPGEVVDRICPALGRSVASNTRSGAAKRLTEQFQNRPKRVAAFPIGDVPGVTPGQLALDEFLNNRTRGETRSPDWGMIALPETWREQLTSAERELLWSGKVL